MNNYIMYNDNEGLKLLIPAMDIDITILADKDVPSGTFYKIVTNEDFPSQGDISFWTMEINKDNADGIGLTKEEFDKKYPEYSGWAVK